MDKYDLLNQIGDGTFGSVAKAVNKKTGQLVAIKKMKQKYYTWEECVKLPEVDVVRRIHGHPNIVKLREVIRENSELFFVFEYMDGDLLGVIKKAKQSQKPEDMATGPAIPYPRVKSFMHQILQSLAYLHRRGYFHRDLKPENLLIKSESPEEEVVKLADFGLVKEIRARPPFTDYVSTRWYRAPELLLQDRAYSTPVDIWAAGCIMCELITTKPLFPGTNEVDQLFKIMSVLGSPTEKVWPAGVALARKIRYAFPSIQGMGLIKALPPHVPAQVIDLLSQMLTYDPKGRPTAEQCLQHPYFSVGVDDTSGPSVATQQQISNAIKRFQPSPQSAPAALQNLGTDPHGTVGGDKAKQTHTTTSAAGPTISNLSASPHKYYMLGLPKTKDTAESPAKAADGKDAGQAASPAPSGATSGKPTQAEAGGAPTTNKGTLAVLNTTPLKNQPIGIKGLSITTAKPTLSKPPLASATTTGAAAGSSPRHTLANRKGSELPQLGSSRPAGTKGPSPTPGKSGGVELAPQGAASVAPDEPKTEVDLADLMEEFAAELTSLGVNTQRTADPAPNRGKASPYPARSSIGADPIAALLTNSRYRKASNSPADRKVSVSTTGKPAALTGPARGVKLPEVTKAGVSAPTRSDGQSSQAVSPSIKALLAKHRAGGFAFQ